MKISFLMDVSPFWADGDGQRLGVQMGTGLPPLPGLPFVTLQTQDDFLPAAALLLAAHKWRSSPPSLSLLRSARPLPAHICSHCTSRPPRSLDSCPHGARDTDPTGTALLQGFRPWWSSIRNAKALTPLCHDCFFLIFPFFRPYAKKF